jgi:hypothetical protein
MAKADSWDIKIAGQPLNDSKSHVSNWKVQFSCVQQIQNNFDDKFCILYITKRHYSHYIFNYEYVYERQTPGLEQPGMSIMAA